MRPSKKQSFTALLEPDHTRLRWIIARVPFDPAQVWPQRIGLRVRGAISGFAFRTLLFAWSGGRGCYLLVNKQMQDGANARVGDKVRVVLEPDLDEREVAIPAELERELKGARGLRRWFDGLSESSRRDIATRVSQPKFAETRQKRAAKMAERLLQAMEGETDPPPELRVLFERQPLARVGWEAMTLAQRRGQLMGIFYYESGEARERRTMKAVDEAVRLAKKQQNR